MEDSKPPSVVGRSMNASEREKHEIQAQSYSYTKEEAVTTQIQTSNKESRTMAALEVKEEQYQSVNKYNMELLSTLNTLDDEKKELQMSKIALEQENEVLRSKNFEMQSKVRASEIQLRKSENELEDKEKQHKIMTDHNSEILRLLEQLENEKAIVDKDRKQLQENVEILEGKYTSLVSTAKQHENMAVKAAYQGKLRAEEVRLLRVEAEQLRGANTEIKMKTQVEVESLQDQLRLAKEKQYQLLQKLQADDEARQRAEDQVAQMEENLREVHEKKVELETQLQVESRAKRSQQEANKALTIEVDTYAANNKSMQEKLGRAEQERIRVEAESRDNGEQLTQMSEKVFQLLERMKLAELGKTKAVDALKRKEQEMISLQKKNSRLLKEATNEAKQRSKAELDKKVLLDQIQALKKHNSQLNNRCRDEVKLKLKAIEEHKNLEEKSKMLSSRLNYLLKQAESNEESKIIQKEEIKKLSAQISSLTDRNYELQQKLNGIGESNRVITASMRLKSDEFDALAIKFEALQAKMAAMDNDPNLRPSKNNQDADGGDAVDDDIKTNSTKGYFFVESKQSQGLFLLRSKQGNMATKGTDCLDQYQVNPYLKRAQKSVNMKQLLIEKVGHLLSVIMNKDVSVADALQKQDGAQDHIEHMKRKTVYLQDQLVHEEEAKRRILLRYVDSVKSAQNPTTSTGEPQDNIGQIQLPESGIGDEEVHAIAALLRSNLSIRKLILHRNAITDEGARALAAVLAGKTGLEIVDLRGNKISRNGIKVLSDALERNARIKHVYVHGEGKIQGLGTSVHNGLDTDSAKVDVETLCVVDCRENDSSSGNSKEKAIEQPAAIMPMPAATATKTVLPSATSAERKKSNLMVRQQKKERKQILERNKAAEQRWAGSSGGMVSTLPSLSNDKLGQSSSTTSLKNESNKTLSSSASAANLEGTRRAQNARDTGYARRIKDSPLNK